MRIRRYPYDRRRIRYFTLIPTIISSEEISWLEWIYIEEKFVRASAYIGWIEVGLCTKEAYLEFKERDRKWRKERYVQN